VIKSLRSVMRFRPIELDPTERRLAHVASVADLRRIARHRLPRGVFDYIDGGAEDELTMRRNVAAFWQTELKPRVLRDVSEIDLSVTLLGQHLPLPLVMAPTGFTRVASPGGELDVARAFARRGLPFTLSTMATRSIEEVAAVSDGTKWLQVYVWRDRGLLKEMLSRASGAGYQAITITVDTAVLGRRERDVRRGFTMPPQLDLATIADGILHPAWTWNFARAEPITFANIVGGSAPNGEEAVNLAQYMSEQFDPGLSWHDLDWFRANWDGPILLKGIQTVDDARLAADAGVEGVILSNHGGRQLDGAPPSLELVAPVADAVGDRVEIICDGGVRRGSDLLKAVALGARACMTGRAVLYGLGAAGERGVDKVLSLLESDLRRTMALTGYRRMSDLGPDVVRWRGTAGPR
jgi:L-lactate dehydrogenase (cytochrome)